MGNVTQVKNVNCMSALGTIPGIIPGILKVWRLPQVLLGVSQLLLGYHSPDLAAQRMDDPSLTADHAIFKGSSLTEIRPGRQVMLLDLTAAHPDKTLTSHGNSSDAASEDGRWTVFFVHGSMATMQQFESQIAELHGSGNCRVVAYDAYGCGQSPRPHDFAAYSQENSFYDMKAVFDRYKGVKNLVVGHSYGCSQVVRLANARPEEVHGLVLIGPGFAPEHFPAKAIKVFSAPLVLLKLMRPLLSKGFAERAFHPRTREQSCDAHRRLLLRAEKFSGTNSMHVCQAFYQQMQWVGVSDLESVACGVLVVVGEGDKVTPVGYARSINEILRRNQNRLVKYKEVQDASHQVMQERPDQVCTFIADFLRELETTETETLDM